MATRQGRCTNFDNCDTADSHQIVPVPQGADFVCPRCGKALSESNGSGGRTTGVDPKLLALAAAVVVLLLIVFGIWKYMSGSRDNRSTAGNLRQARTILRLSGSNTIGASLGPATAVAFLKDQGATDARILPGASQDEKIVAGTLPEDSSPVKITIAAHGTATAFTSMLDGSADIGMASRQIKPQEASSLSALGDMYSSACENVLGLDGIAVIVNASNPVNALSKDQIQSLFTEDGMNWAGVGGEPGGVNVYARDDKSGTYDTFKSLVLGNKALSSGVKRLADSDALSEAVANDPKGIGFVGLPYVHSAKALAVSERGARALQPTQLTVATQSYLLSRKLYLYTAANPQNTYVRKFILFALSNAGQDAVQSNGFVGQRAVINDHPDIPADAPEAYRQLTKGNGRLPYDFRFQSGKYILDNNSMVDVQRVVDFVASMKYTGDNIMLFGFTDSVGNAAKNMTLSQNRAADVEEQFKQRGLRPSVVRGFGADLPVASNDTDEGKSRNRRVEIWVRR